MGNMQTKGFYDRWRLKNLHRPCFLGKKQALRLKFRQFLKDEALATDYIDESELQTLQDWRKDPENWGQTVKKAKK